MNNNRGILLLQPFHWFQWVGWWFQKILWTFRKLQYILRTGHPSNSDRDKGQILPVPK